MNKRTKGCLWIALGVAVVLVMVTVAVVGGLGYLVYNQFSAKATFVPPDRAAKELDAIRARFPGEPHLRFEDTGDGARRVVVDKPATNATPKPLTSLNVAMYEKNAGKLVRFSMPFWLVRLAPEGQIHIRDRDDEVIRAVKGRLSPRELEALGPGLLVDTVDDDGARVLVWTE
jgi:hypothetical protein